MQSAAGDLLPYEKQKNRNALTRFVHGSRYKYLRSFVRDAYDGPIKVLDIGCGPGEGYHTLSEFPVDYTGVDIREDFIATAQRRYEGSGARFLLVDVTDRHFDFSGYDLIMALETFEHIPEGKLVRVIERIADARPKYLFCSVPVEIGPAVAIKNFACRAFGYDRKSGDLWQTLYAATYNLNKLPPHGVYHLGFNWFWLEQTLRHNLQVVRSQSLPYSFLPKWLAPTVTFVCRPYGVSAAGAGADRPADRQVHAETAAVAELQSAGMPLRPSAPG